MAHIDRSMAKDMIEDALQGVGDPVGQGIAIGMCSAFYLCGMIGPSEWESYQKRTQAPPRLADRDHPAGPTDGG